MGVKIKRRKFDILHFHFYSLTNLQFLPFFLKKNHILLFVFMLPMPYQWFTVENIIHISLKIPLIRIRLSIGSLNGKKRLSEGPTDFFLSNFSFLYLQIKSKIENLRQIKSCTQ